jgi:ribosomal protein L11 methyltransferase
MTAFTEISVITDGEAAEAVAEVLRPFAYQQSVVLEQKGDPDSVDPMAVEDVITVKIFVPEEDDTPQLRRRIEEILYHMNRLYPIGEPAFQILQETDWANAWKDNYHPFRVGHRFVIRPSWADEAETPTSGESDLTLVMDPGMAFGTGLHPTTQTCLMALEKVTAVGDSVLDVGTGTGILGIAAAKLGSGAVTAVDTDELAVRAAIENAELNKVRSKLHIWQGELSSVDRRPFDVVVVNILAPVINRLLQSEELMEYVAGNGRLILSGIVDSQAGEVEATVETAGGRVAERLEQGDWATLIVKHGEREAGSAGDN